MLSRAGGFCLDDPEGEVRIEFTVVVDWSGPAVVAYSLPLTYRAALEGGEDAIVGTAERGVDGTRWVYDGARDSVLLSQLLALLTGRAEPQAQSVSDTPDRSVTVSAVIDDLTATRATSDTEATADLVVNSARKSGAVLRLVRVLRPTKISMAAWLSPP